MSRIFISHSSANNAEAIALRDWLVSEGWSDLFLDLDPDRGIAAGERWERALNEAARRCEAVIFLISKAWLGSRWCTNELTLARRLNKRLFGVLVEEGLTVADLPADVTSTWQLVNLATGRDHKQFRVTLPVTGAEAARHLLAGRSQPPQGWTAARRAARRAISTGRRRLIRSARLIVVCGRWRPTTPAFSSVARRPSSRRSIGCAG